MRDCDLWDRNECLFSGKTWEQFTLNIKVGRLRYSRPWSNVQVQPEVSLSISIPPFPFCTMLDLLPQCAPDRTMPQESCNWDPGDCFSRPSGAGGRGFGSEWLGVNRRVAPICRSPAFDDLRDAERHVPRFLTKVISYSNRHSCGLSAARAPSRHPQPPPPSPHGTFDSLTPFGTNFITSIIRQTLPHLFAISIEVLDFILINNADETLSGARLLLHVHAPCHRPALEADNRQCLFWTEGRTLVWPWPRIHPQSHNFVFKESWNKTSICSEILIFIFLSNEFPPGLLPGKVFLHISRVCS